MRRHTGTLESLNEINHVIYRSAAIMWPNIMKKHEQHGF